MDKLIVSLSLLLLAVISGCTVSGRAVKEHNLLNVFFADESHEKVAGVITDMSRYCDTGVFVVESKYLSNINKSVIDYRVKNGAQYFMHIEVEETGNRKSKVSIYHYMNTAVTKNMARKIEDWVISGEKDCVNGF